MAARFWQIKVAEEDKYKTAHAILGELYEYNVIPFELKGTPATFQRLMQKVLGKYMWDFILIYLDDIIIYSKSLREHIDHIRLVFQALQEAELKIKMEKCAFAWKELKYLGFRIGQDGVAVDPDKIKAIEEQSPPTNQTGIRAFNGMVGFFRNLIEGYSLIMGPMTDLLKKDTPFIWRPEQQKAFDTIKEKLTTVPVLAHSNFEKPFLLYTDISKEGVGTILAQKQPNGRIYPVQFVSHRNNKAEQNYLIMDLEGLAVIWAVKKLKRYLRNVLFTIITDHSALKHIFGGDEIPDERRGRWMVYF